MWSFHTRHLYTLPDFPNRMTSWPQNNLNTTPKIRSNRRRARLLDRSLAQTLARSIARSLYRSLDRSPSLPRSLAFSLHRCRLDNSTDRALDRSLARSSFAHSLDRSIARAAPLTRSRSLTRSPSPSGERVGSQGARRMSVCKITKTNSFWPSTQDVHLWETPSLVM